MMVFFPLFEDSTTDGIKGRWLASRNAFYHKYLTHSLHIKTRLSEREPKLRFTYSLISRIRVSGKSRAS